jgi:hypothetical protein
MTNLRGGGYTANSYLQVLNDEMPKCFELGWTFMQDNASIHSAKKNQEMVRR